jgi:hypothetical protein
MIPGVAGETPLHLGDGKGSVKILYKPQVRA